MWAPDGRELFYRNGDKMMAVEIEREAEFRIGRPQLIFEGQYAPGRGFFDRPNYKVTPDGQRFLMIQAQQGAGAPINVVLNWFEELKERVPVP